MAPRRVVLRADGKIGYFYNGLSGPLEGLAAPVVALGDVHGGEAYYNAAITPWFHLTFDLQAIESDVKARDTAVVLGNARQG